MGINTRKWLNDNRNELRKKYPNKTVIVCENKVVKDMEGPVNPIEINKIAAEICKSKEWSYTFLEENEEEYLL